jgi:hypothetical protein
MFILEACDSSSMLNTILLVKRIINIVFVVVPLLLVIFLTVDIAKNVLNADEEKTQENVKTGVRRIIYSLVLLFVPLLVQGFMGMIDGYSKVASCYTIATEAKVDELYAKEEEEYQKQREKELQQREDNASLVEKENEEQSKAAREAERAARKSSKKDSSSAYSNVSTSKYTKTNGRIAQATGGEHGCPYGCKAGDQSGGEVSTSKFSYGSGYNTWIYAARFKDPAKAEIVARCMEAAAKNNNIGYDQKYPDRVSLYDAAKKVNFDVSKVNKKVETTCSSVVSVCINAAGVKFPAKAYADNHEIINELKSRNKYFTEVTQSKKNTKHLNRGDILCSESHTAVAL